MLQSLELSIFNNNQKTENRLTPVTFDHLILEIIMYFSEHDSDELALVEEFFFLVDAPEDGELEPIHLIAQVDLAEFRFTESELQKLRRLTRKLEFALSDEFSRQWAAASVVVEIRSSSGNPT